MERRDFLIRLGRLVLLGILGTVSVLTIKRDGLQENSNCTNRAYCRKCRKLAECGQPEAVILRERQVLTNNT